MNESIKDRIYDILTLLYEGKTTREEALRALLALYESCFTKNEVDAAYIIGILNTGGIDVLGDELNRLFGLSVKPSDIILKLRQ